MTPTKSGDTILHKLGLGFTIIIAIVWLVELVRLPHLLLGEPAVFHWPRVLIRTAVLLLIWFWLHRTTRRLLQRLRELEDYLRVCSWCRKVGHEGGWHSLEEFFASNLDTRTSHSICPDCAARTQSILPSTPRATRVSTAAR
jgi:hypothetical protein